MLQEALSMLATGRRGCTDSCTMVGKSEEVAPFDRVYIKDGRGCDGTGVGTSRLRRQGRTESMFTLFTPSKDFSD